MDSWLCVFSSKIRVRSQLNGQSILGELIQQLPGAPRLSFARRARKESLQLGDRSFALALLCIQHSQVVVSYAVLLPSHRDRLLKLSFGLDEFVGLHADNSQIQVDGR